mmetsp:Transcript_49797/g.116584  ORF Transcript_49797/g.116584 Transcript_49797/m.116584 type:complete len:207 (-) Transcript_49797:862-1482(-)
MEGGSTSREKSADSIKSKSPLEFGSPSRFVSFFACVATSSLSPASAAAISATIGVSASAAASASSGTASAGGARASSAAAAAVAARVAAGGRGGSRASCSTPTHRPPGSTSGQQSRARGVRPLLARASSAKWNRSSRAGLCTRSATRCRKQWPVSPCSPTSTSCALVSMADDLLEGGPAASRSGVGSIRSARVHNSTTSSLPAPPS